MLKNIITIIFLIVVSLLSGNTSSNSDMGSVFLYAFLIGIITLFLCYLVSSYLVKTKVKQYQDSNNNTNNIIAKDNPRESVSFKMLLHECKNLHDSIINQSADGIFIGDKLGNFIEVNPAGELLTGYSKDELLTMKMDDLFADKELSRNPLRYDLLDVDKSLVKERNLKTKDGEIISVEMNSKILINGDLLTNMRDLTFRKEKEKVVMESEKKLRTIFNAMDHLILELNDKGVYINIAPTAHNLLYKDQQELLGKSIIDVLPQDVATPIMKTIRKCLTGKSKESMKYKLEIKGKILDFKAVIVPKTEETVLFVAEDISEQESILRELEQYRTQLESLVKERTKELEEKNNELIKLNGLFAGREFRIKELRDRIKEMEESD